MREGRWGAGVAGGVLVLAGLGVGGAGGTAVADGGGLEVRSDLGHYALDATPYTDLGSSGDSLTLLNTGTKKVKSYTITIDYTSLKGIAEVTLPGCGQKSEGVLSCSPAYPPAPGKGASLGTLSARSLKGAKAGATGEIRIGGQADGVAMAEKVWTVTVKDAGLVADRTIGTVAGKVEPGSLVRPGIGYTNYGAEAIDGAYFLMYGAGASFRQEFGNCTYGTLPVRMDGDPNGELTDVSYPAALCHVEDTIEPGQSYDLYPGELKIAGDVRGASWSVFRSKPEELRKLTDVHAGHGPKLQLVPRPADAPEGEPRLGLHDVHYAVDNTTDIEAVGASVRGRPGGTVTAEIGFRNNGPARTATWTGSRPIEDPSVRTVFTVPAGTTVVKVPERCHTTVDGDYSTAPGGKVYECVQKTTDWVIENGARLVWSFGLRVDKPSALKPGKVTLKVLSESDSDPENDTAAVTVTVPGGGGSTGGGGTTGGGGDSGGNGNGGASGGTAASGGTTTGGGAQESSVTGGSMAGTGAGTLPWIAGTAGLLAVAVGAGVFVLARRRRGGA
ncbi:hypothetical protein [Streptomyces anandii]|uniref:hypothetical protein n=1 Tax=Streptomyces anandii TaxID=285454 RepID=UPI00167A8FFE|nr:hypothetical protein [Streptomyces anandii]GGX62133.1 hypothetical protein GCM10010510_03120 [Streptomyces anandii JCM 4720]